MTTSAFSARLPSLPTRSAWLLPAIMLGICLAALIVAELAPPWAALSYFVPFTFLGNSLAPLPYDAAVVYLGPRYSLGLIVSLAVAATLVIEIWNMELLARVLAREGTRAFRNHRFTQWSLHWYGKAPFWSLVLTCVLPIVPHYPMRFLAVLAGYPLWKYLGSVILGRGARYTGLVMVGTTVPIPGSWLLAISLLILVLAMRGAHRMNRTSSDLSFGRGTEAVSEEI